MAPYANTFRLSPFGNVLEVEPNDNHPTATAFTPPMALNGVIGKPGDVDHYVFKATKGQTFDVKVFARGLRSPLDSVLYIGARNGGAMAGNDDSAGPDSYIRFTAPADGEYVVWLVDQLQKGGPDYAYRIGFSPVQAKLNLSVGNESVNRGTGIIAVAVPKGNRQAILVNAGRADFGGDLAITATGLPAGVALEADPMAANLGTYPVLFTAKADAPAAGALATLTGKHVDPKVNIPSEFSQTIELVLGQNNIPFWTRTVNTLAVAVTEECPYSIEIVEPKVPLVRGGSMSLKVVAKRKAGFTAPIAISLPWNPPGVGSSGGVSIPEKQNEALIPMNADGGAELKTWKIVVNGASSGPTGPILVSSQLAKLSIAAPFVGLRLPGRERRAGQGGRNGGQGLQERRLPWRSDGEPDRSAEQGHDGVQEDHQGHDRPRVPHQDRQGVPRGQSCEPVLPGRDHAGGRADRAQHRDRTVADRRAAAAQAERPAPAPAAKPVAAAPKPAAPAAKPLSRLEKLRLEAQERAKAAK